MSEYTPTTDEVRDAYASSWDQYDSPTWYAKCQAEFDRWLAAEKVKWQAEALREYATAVEKHADMNVRVSWSDVVRDARQYASVFFEEGSDDDR